MKTAADLLLNVLKSPVQGLQSLHQSLVRTCNNFAEAMNRAAAREVANSPAMRGYMAQKGKDYLLYSAHSSATLTESPSRNQKYENLGAKRCGFHRCVQLFPRQTVSR
jgi:hypothetical protein